MEYYEFVDLMSRVPWGEQGSLVELSAAVQALFDRQHDGLTSLADVRRLLTSLGEPLSDEQLDIMLKQLVPDGDGRVTCAGSISSPTFSRSCLWLVAWSSGRALVFGRCAFAVLRSTCS